ncbi:MAG: cytochrome C [Proteobacteria bacterium]|nr:cytochrome C [Pseudomonadota bacterium]
MRWRRIRLPALAILFSLLPFVLVNEVCQGQTLKLGEEVEEAKKRFKIRDREYCLECIDNSKCLECHDNVNEVKFVRSVHGANSCNSCHWDITDIDEHTVAGARIQAEAVTCHRCHKVEGAEHYASAHFINDVKCQDCHFEIHEITAWKGNKARVIQKCTICHEDDGYFESIHGQAVLAGNKDSAVCSDCHELHKTPILSGEEPERVEFRRLFHTQVCQKCHADKEMMKRNNVLLIANETYQESYHGKVEYLGYPTLVAGCADCHGFHNILHPDNLRSTISKPRLVETCVKCHANANANFVQWIAHADHYDKENYPVLYWTFVFMTALLVGVFGVFWLHSFLWWQKAYREKRKMWAAGEFLPPYVEKSGDIYRRFDNFDITVHFVMMVSFLLLVLTGLPLKFSHAEWARGLVKLFGGISNAGLIHRISAVVTFAYFSAILVNVVYFIFFRRDVKGGPLKRLFGPDSLAPRWQDVKDITGMVKWFFGKGPKPRFDRWTYWEKFDFLAVFWGMFAIGLSGLMLWFPDFFSIFLPGWIFNVALIVHSDEALLASGFIFTVHFFNTHFRPEKFPMDVGIFTGRFPKVEFIDDRPGHYDRLVSENRLFTFKAKHPSVLTYLWGQLFGFGGIFIGTISIFLILWGFFG